MSDRDKIERLKDEADIGDVVNYLGLEIKKMGSAYFILCPHPQHEDTHATNCYYKDGWNNVYCRACGHAINAIDLIIYERCCSFSEATEILWELEGRPLWYKCKPRQNMMTFQLTRDEMKLIGIKMPGKIKLAENYSDIKPVKEKGKILEGDLYGYVVCRNGYHQWNDFVSENEFLDIVMNKAYEKFRLLYARIDELKVEYYALKHFGERNKELEAVIIDVINDMLKCQEIYYRAKKKRVS